MKRLSFSLIIILTTFSLKIQAQNKFISKLYPNEITVQYAGNIGLVSAGPTWNYAKNECLSTTLMLGYVPGYLGNKSTVCLSLSKIYTPWHITWKNKMGFEPLTVGVMVSSIFGKDYWLVEPNYYPDNYYGFSTSLRFYLIFGQQFPDFDYAPPRFRARVRMRLTPPATVVFSPAEASCRGVPSRILHWVA